LNKAVITGAVTMRVLFAVVGMLGVTAGYCQDNQAGLDSKCEEARQIALGPLKQELFKECVGKGKEEAVCKSEADQYNGARPDRGPIFYDLPECEEAFNYKKNNGR
jgi:hypothetical protein